MSVKCGVLKDEKMKRNNKGNSTEKRKNWRKEKQKDGEEKGISDAEINQ